MCRCRSRGTGSGRRDRRPRWSRSGHSSDSSRGVERRAFRIAQLSVRDRDDALDIVQDAMIRLARHYGGHPQQQWPPLFYGILRNRITDCLRRRRVRGRVLRWWSATGPDDAAADLPEQVPDPAGRPEEQLEGGQLLERLEQALAELPDRQREAFLLRNFEGLDVAQTALAMGCSEGSVKTHYFRAVHALRERIGAGA
ncbi:MAG: RNA polymerase sigma factor [Gammaproteobacteria bacterium]|nr:RNA polymerase sigma factor [Gammaproteobacteria bacterium]